MTIGTNEVERDELLERLRRVAHGGASVFATYATPVDYLDAVARIERLTRERDQARADRDREAFDRQTAQDAWNDMRQQRDAALVRAQIAERFIAHADSGWKARAEKAEAALAELLARVEELEEALEDAGERMAGDDA